MATQTLPDLTLPVRDVAEPVFGRLLEVETVFQGMARLRLDPEARRCVYFYVTDGDERLVGVAPARRLLFADPAALVGEIVKHPALAVTADETFGNAVALMAEQRLLALPMVDGENRLSGVLDISTFTHTLWHEEQRRQAEEAQMAGVHLSSCSSAPEREDRSSWLWTSAVAALLLPLLVSGFRDTLSRFLPIAYFIPLTMLLAGSVALRTVARRLLHGRAGARPCIPLRAEVRAGGTLAAIVAMVAAVFSKDLRIALVVGCGVPAALITGAAAGYSVPRVLQRWRRQARVASGPSVLALAAAAALCCYLALAAAILR